MRKKSPACKMLPSTILIFVGWGIRGLSLCQGAFKNIGGYEARGIVSGAGHDACYMSKVAPTAMVFVPCIDGISHNEVEDAKPEWITAGGNVLLRAIVEKAGSAD